MQGPSQTRADVLAEKLEPALRSSERRSNREPPWSM